MVRKWSFLTEFFLVNFYFLGLRPSAMDVFKSESSFARVARRRIGGVGGQKVQNSPACRHFCKGQSISGFWSCQNGENRAENGCFWGPSSAVNRPIVYSSGLFRPVSPYPAHCALEKTSEYFRPVKPFFLSAYHFFCTMYFALFLWFCFCRVFQLRGLSWFLCGEDCNILLYPSLLHCIALVALSNCLHCCLKLFAAFRFEPLRVF